jgi:transcription initiation factor TFIID subunit TAF12
MHMMERILTNAINAGFVGMIPATVGAVEQETRYQQEIDRQEEQFRQEQAQRARRRILRLGCE